MERVMMLRRAGKPGVTYGGQVYMESLLKLFRKAYPRVELEQLAMVDSHGGRGRRVRQIISVLRSVFGRFPAKVVHFRSAAFARRIQFELSRRVYDLVIVNCVDLMWCVELFPRGMPVLYISQNVEHQLYREQIKAYDRLPVLAQILHRDADRLECLELDTISRVSGVISLSREDTDYFSSRCPSADIETIGPTFNYPVPERRIAVKTDAEEIRLGFLGKLDWWPNRQGVRWFIERVFPAIPDHFILHLFGEGSESMDDGERIIGHGFVDDLDQVWEICDFMIQPITSGGGINIKVAETIYNRVPMVATPAALRGLALHSDEAIVVREGHDEWIRFLRGSGPAALAGRRGRMENAALFCADANVDRMTAIIGRIGEKRRQGAAQ